MGRGFLFAMFIVEQLISENNIDKIIDKYQNYWNKIYK
jgi:hypothetical protein